MELAPEQRIDTRLEGIGHILRDRLLAVPSFQRSFAWGNQQVEAFLSDITAAMNGPLPIYFMGTVVLTHRSRSRTLIIDGQQRLATVTMLLAALRDHLLEAGDDERAAVLERDYIASRTLARAQMEPRLQLNIEDDAFFQARVVARPPRDVVAVRPSHRRIDEAMNLLRQRVDLESSQAGPHWDHAILRWADFVEEQLQVIRVDVPTEADAYIIFETLNDRGLDLTVGDLLRNYLFSLAEDDLPTVERHWVQAVEALDLASESQVFIAFLRHFWSSRYGAIRERELYQAMRRRIRTQPAAVAFAQALASSAPNYAALLDPNDDRWQALGVQRDTATTLVKLGLEQYRPLLLAAMDRLDLTQLESLVRSLVGWSVRGLVVGGIGGGTTERYYADAAASISGGTITATDEVFSLLAPILPTDSAFAAAFANEQASKLSLARYYLLAIEKRIRGETNPAIVELDMQRNIQALHLLPRVTSRALDQWPAFREDEANQWASRLGNIVLVSTDQAREIRGASWDQVVGRLSDSQFATTRMAATAGEWTPDAIRDRQTELARLAVETWPRGIGGAGRV